MSASKYIKKQGLPSLAYVARKCNRTEWTLHNWYKLGDPMFEVVVAGVWLHYADENKQPDPNITEETKEMDREYLKRARWNQ